ncbi:MAG: holdfast anchoring protein HfaB [Caulobacterales bacterium]|jgi:curli production assembly/transport component CsgG/holdfast attachment protein HfaB
MTSVMDRTTTRKAGPFVALAAAALLAGCVTPASGSDGMYALPIGDAPVTANPTAYTPALNCLASYASSRGLATPRVAVGRIIDYTGRIDDEGGRQITQGASLMAITAFAKSGARLVERFDTSVTELELRYANNRLIGQEGQGDDEVRRIYAGQIPGSDYFFVGGITELNYNIRSLGGEAFVSGTGTRSDRGSLTGRLFVMNIALDFRLVDTNSLEVVDVISYQKQILGREVRAGVFSFFDDTLVDLSVGERALEPVQLAVRAGVERAVVEVMANLYGVADTTVCADAISAQGDPMGPTTAQATGDFRTMTGPAAQSAAERRSDINAWTPSRDAGMGQLRGRTGAAAATNSPAASTPAGNGNDGSRPWPPTVSAAPAAVRAEPTVAPGAPRGLTALNGR